MEAEERFGWLVERFAGRPGVEGPAASGRGFGAQALKVNGSIFAMVIGGQLVVKLPRHRVDALIADGTGLPFASGKGRPMKEWLRVANGAEETWLSLTGEALEFVGRHTPR